MPEPFDDWIEEESLDEDEEDYSIDEYDLTATPNDFNVKTIIDFIEKQIFEIPAFQRNYVWDLRRASKLIESLVMGLPVPQIFLYEEKRNKFLVIDGQQRLMSVYFFVKKRFPRMERRGTLRQVFDEHGRMPADVLSDDAYFQNFNLKLPAKLPQQANRLDRKNYDTLGEYQTTFDLRTVRCVVIKQTSPKADDTSVYEIFNRLNTGGMNLTPQEIRASLYHSDFFVLLYRLNAESRWRTLIGAPEPDLRMRDVEVLLRGFAMLIQGGEYRPSMTRFLNQFAKDMRGRQDPEQVRRLEAVFSSFLDACRSLPKGIFGTRSRKLNVSVFESVFAAACGRALKGNKRVRELSEDSIVALKSDPDFVSAASTKSTDKKKVEIRLSLARKFIGQKGS